MIPEAVRVWLLGGFRLSVGSRTIGENRWQWRNAAVKPKTLVMALGVTLAPGVVAPVSEGQPPRVPFLQRELKTEVT